MKSRSVTYTDTRPETTVEEAFEIFYPGFDFVKCRGWMVNSIREAKIGYYFTDEELAKFNLMRTKNNTK